ncbi:MAG: DUF3575 domain-containing protein [Saprospiraceae bacterium]
MFKFSSFVCRLGLLFKLSRLALICSLLLSTTLSSQNQVFDFGIEFQAYPTGLIPGLRLEKGFAEQHAVHLRLGYNWLRHQGYGVHEDERGGGLGFTLGYKYYFKEGFERWFLGVKNDIWWNEVDWKDQLGTANEISGTSNITVVQPTLEAGFTLMAGENWTFSPSLAFGYEVNVKTKGAPTGEGPIVLLGFTFGKRW